MAWQVTIVSIEETNIYQYFINSAFIKCLICQPFNDWNTSYSKKWTGKTCQNLFKYLCDFRFSIQCQISFCNINFQKGCSIIEMSSTEFSKKSDEQRLSCQTPFTARADFLTIQFQPLFSCGHKNKMVIIAIGRY